MEWYDAIKKGLLKGLDTLGRVRLYKNDGEPLPDAQAASVCTSHHADTGNPHDVSDSQVHAGVGGTVSWQDPATLDTHTVIVSNGRITSWKVGGVEQLS